MVLLSHSFLTQPRHLYTEDHTLLFPWLLFLNDKPLVFRLNRCDPIREYRILLDDIDDTWVSGRRENFVNVILVTAGRHGVVPLPNDK